MPGHKDICFRILQKNLRHSIKLYHPPGIDVSRPDIKQNVRLKGDGHGRRLPLNVGRLRSFKLLAQGQLLIIHITADTAAGKPPKNCPDSGPNQCPLGIAADGLTKLADVNAGNLPYGDQRRLEIARAMCIQPSILCLDEPAAGLNPKESGELNKLINYIKDEHKIGVLLIEHDMSVVMEISDHIIVLDYGSKISDGTPEFVRSDPNVIRAYLGEEEDDELPPEVAADLKDELRTEEKGA